MGMTLNDISRKLFKNSRKQYGLFFFSVVFSIAMTGAYGVLQYSPTVTNVLVLHVGNHCLSCVCRQYFPKI